MAVIAGKKYPYEKIEDSLALIRRATYSLRPTKRK
jgi:hypothetical protein